MNTRQSRPVWLNSAVFVYDLTDGRVESHCSHLKNYRHRALFEERAPLHPGNHRV